MKKEKDSVEEEQEQLKGEYYVLYQERTVCDAVCTACAGGRRREWNGLNIWMR